MLDCYLQCSLENSANRLKTSFKVSLAETPPAISPNLARMAVYSFTVYLLLSKVHFTDLFKGQHYLKKIYIKLR